MVGFVASGSGKSTIASLLLRYYDADRDDRDEVENDEEKAKVVKGSGHVLLGGNDIKSYNLKWLRSQISIVSQDPVSLSSKYLYTYSFIGYLH